MKLNRYETRYDAGRILIKYIVDHEEPIKDLIVENPNNFMCFAIPNGGVPIAEGFCSEFNLQYDILIVRKIKIPYNTEAGFGAVTTDGTVLINENLLIRLNLTNEEVKKSIDLTKNEIKERLKYYNKNYPNNNLSQRVKHKYIFLLDDGLASGFTMLAAINMLKKYQPLKIFVAVPTAPLRTVTRIKTEINEVFCPNISDKQWFAVADAYKNWYDIPESEVLKIIKNSKYFYSKCS